jgi:NADPH:quinone reductase-like Zn-dependent oxidoreductase
VTLADFEGSGEHGVRFSNGFVDGHAFHSLTEAGELIEAGRFWLPVDKTFPLAHIAEAHRTSEHGRVRGRLVPAVG